MEEKTKKNPLASGYKKRLKGVVVSDKMDKTVVVMVGRFVKNRRYGKFVNVGKKYKVHDEENRCKVGDKIIIEETRPLSKDKRFTVIV
ncbi:MAG: 30S ribosomal protein S17 [Patescibacteria group bacterium]